MRSLWEELIHSRAFWMAYVKAGVSFAGCASLVADRRKAAAEPYCGAQLTFPFPGSHQLTFDISDGEHSLKLWKPDLEAPIEVGRMDCHQMSDAFRWDELQVLVRCLAREIKPVWAVELLLSFYVAVTEDCAAEHLTLLQRCLIASEVFSTAEIEHIIAYTKRIAIRKDFRWIEDADRGWVAEGRDAYSMRHTRGSFNFDAFRVFLVAARHT